MNKIESQSKLRTSRLITASEGLILVHTILHSHSGFPTCFPITLWKQPHQKKKDIYIYIYTYNIYIYIYHINISYTNGLPCHYGKSSNSKKKKKTGLFSSHETKNLGNRAGLSPSTLQLQMARLWVHQRPPLPGTLRSDLWWLWFSQVLTPEEMREIRSSKAKWEKKKKLKINLKQRGGKSKLLPKNPEMDAFSFSGVQGKPCSFRNF